MSSDDNNMRPQIGVWSSPNKAKKFGRKSTTGSAPTTPGSEASEVKSTVAVTIVKPTTKSASAMGGIVVVPKGFMADKWLGNILSKKASESPTTQLFLEKTGAIPFIVYGKDDTGNRINKWNQDSLYPIKSCFIPMDDEEVDDKEHIEKTVRRVGFEIHNSIQHLPTYYSNRNDKGAYEMPFIRDWDTEVRTVTTFHDAIIDRADPCEGKTLYMVVHLSLKSADNNFLDWLKETGNNNIYSIFHPGHVDFTWFNKYKCPFECLNNHDKAAFNKWLEEKKEKLRENTPPDGEGFDVPKFFGFKKE